MLNGHKSPIITGDAVRVLCSCVVDLISRVQRPWLFRVTVTGLPPHNCTRVYEIAAKSDNDAALVGLKIFSDQMSTLTPLMDYLAERSH
jgi:hypothetical protein